ncbi:MAG: hypothetical protein AAB612_02105 [Patescibacteria group bacterium]
MLSKTDKKWIIVTFDERFDKKFDEKFDKKFDEKFDEKFAKVQSFFINEVAKFKDEIVGVLNPLQIDHDILTHQVSELRQSVAVHDHTSEGLSWIRSIHLTEEETQQARETMRVWREEYQEKKKLGKLSLAKF